MGKRFGTFALACAMFVGVSAQGSERIRKFELALRALGIPVEKTPDFSAYPDPGTVSVAEVRSIAKYIDPSGGLRRYLFLDPDRVELYPDFYRTNGPNDRPDYEVAAGDGKSRDSADLLDRLDRVARNVRAGSRPHSLVGLRVVIDPGHIGTPFWNEKDGKFVTIKGKTVAEGELALWVAKLLANELEKLGAEVLLTRTDLVPVTPYTWETFDPAGRLADYYYKSMDDWMAKYLELPDAELVRRLPSAPEVKKMSTTAGRIHLFLQEDMDARAKIAERYRPDLFIDLHYDSQLTDQLQSARDDVAVYVPGAVGANETGAKNQRADALKHLLEVRRWKQSTKAAKSMVDSLARNLGLPLLKEGEPGTMVRVADGVFARNIFETKRATSGISAFFESFHYDHTREFPRLTVLDRTGTYRGKSFRYPARLDAVVTGIRDGLLAYFRDFSIED